jgi:hypothetical protein
MGVLKKYLPKKRSKRVLIYAVSTLFVALAVDMGLTAYWRRISISKEVTYITSPLFPQGTPDYLTWLNERASRGVTPENNAAVPLLKATGLAEGSSALGARMLLALGIPDTAVAQRVRYYNSWARQESEKGGVPKPADQQAEMAQEKQWEEEEVEMVRMPWKAADHPQWAQWLAVHRESLALAHEAARRERYYVPAVTISEQTSPGLAMAALLPTIGPTRVVGRMLAAEAMMHADDEDKSVFINNMIDAMKIGLYLRRDPYLVSQMVGMGVMEFASRGICGALATGALRGDDARKMLAALDRLPPVPEIDLTAERLMMLDAWCGQAAYGLSRSPLLAREFRVKKAKLGLLVSLVVPVRFESQMILINQDFDQMDRDFRILSYRARLEAIRKTQKDHLRHLDKAVYTYSLMREVLADAGWEAQACVAFQVEKTQYDLTRLALALAVYKEERGEYPASLVAQARGALSVIPQDGFAERPFVYKRTEIGYLLYGVGQDLADDGGDEKKDMVVRMPH